LAGHAECGLDPLHQFVGADGLRHVFVHSGGEAAVAIFGLRVGGQICW
jgi:hypothetical protein